MKTMTINFINYEKRKSIALKNARNASVKKGLLIALVIAMFTTMLASCDEYQGSTHETGTDTEVTVVEGEETYPEIETVSDYNGISLEAFGLSNVFQDLDFAYLYYDTEGREIMSQDYNLFLDACEEHLGSPMVPYMTMNYFYSLTSDYKNRQNVIWELSDNYSPWSHTIVSTKDDFALVSKYESKYFVTGFVNGKLYDDAYAMGSENYNSIVKLIKKDGYTDVMNTVRDEFWGKMYKYFTGEDGKYEIIITGEISDMLNEDGSYKDATEYTYRIEYAEVESNINNKTVATITPTYDILDNYIDQFIENKNYGGNHGRPNGNNNHWQDGEPEDTTESH